MIKNTLRTINLPLTVEASLQSTNGYLYGRYPSKCIQDSPYPTQIDVRYEGEHIPDIFSHQPVPDASKYQAFSRSTIDFSKPPVFLQIRRADMSVSLYRDTSILPNSKKEITSYSIAIQRRHGHYTKTVLSNGTIVEEGVKRFMEIAQNDTEFAKYICFVHDDEVAHPEKCLKKWQLNQMMEKSRC